MMTLPSIVITHTKNSAAKRQYSASYNLKYVGQYSIAALQRMTQVWLHCTCGPKAGKSNVICLSARRPCVSALGLLSEVTPKNTAFYHTDLPAGFRAKTSDAVDIFFNATTRAPSPSKASDTLIQYGHKSRTTYCGAIGSPHVSVKRALSQR